MQTLNYYSNFANGLREQSLNAYRAGLRQVVLIAGALKGFTITASEVCYFQHIGELPHHPGLHVLIASDEITWTLKQ